MATKKTTSTTKGKTKKEVTHADIQKKAQAIFEERLKNNAPGDELSDWVQAEKELSK